MFIAKIFTQIMVKRLFILNFVNGGAKSGENEQFDKRFLMVKSTPFPNYLLKEFQGLF